MRNSIILLTLFNISLAWCQTSVSAVDYFNQLNNDQNNVSRLCWKYLMEVATSNNLRKNENTRQQLLTATRRAQSKLHPPIKGFELDTPLVVAFHRYYQDVLNDFEKEGNQWLGLQKSATPDFNTWQIQMQGIQALRLKTGQSWTQVNAAKIDFATSHNMVLNRPNWLRAEKLEQVHDAVVYAQLWYGIVLNITQTATPWLTATEQLDGVGLQKTQAQLGQVLAQYESNVNSLEDFKGDQQLQLAVQETFAYFKRLQEHYLPAFQQVIAKKNSYSAQLQALDALPASAEKNEKIKVFNAEGQALQTTLQSHQFKLKEALDGWNTTQKQWQETYYLFITAHIPQD